MMHAWIKAKVFILDYILTCTTRMTYNTQLTHLPLSAVQMSHTDKHTHNMCKHMHMQQTHTHGDRKGARGGEYPIMNLMVDIICATPPNQPSSSKNNN